MGSRVFRVFVSSPSDVFSERERIERVIQRLNGELNGGAKLEAIRWERSYYTADKTFQDQIPPPSQTDLVICVLWKRLGFELPAEYQRADGTTPTGTEYEFEEAMRAAKAKGTPDVLVYRKTAAVLLDAERIDLEKAQFDSLKTFWAHWFQSESGRFTAAYQSFETTDQFEVLVEDHIRQWLGRNQADLADAAVWPIALKGSPFRGLQPFDEAHTDVFFGRRRAVEMLRERLAAAAGRGAPFLLLLGASGSGKSSVARAGLAPRLTQLGAVAGVDLWRRCVLRPSEGGGDLLLGLAQALYRADAAPELSAGDSPTPAEFAALLRVAPDAAARALRLALARAAKVLAAREGFDRPVEARLLLIVDQLEEALVGAPDARDGFAAALSALIDKGGAWIVATLRSDFYAAFQASPPLIAMRERGAQFDLLTPSPAEVAEIVAGPAKAAGLKFDSRPGGAALDEELAEAASAPGSLPLLQMALDELFRARDAQTNVLSVSAYDSFGGLAGVVERRAEATLAALDPEAAGALPAVLAFLVRVSDDGLVASRPCRRAQIESTPGAGRLIDAFVAARLLIAEQQQDEAWLRVAHEALIAGWPRAQALIAAARDALRVRGRVEAAALRWDEEQRQADLLLPPGRPLAEALEFAEGWPHQVSTVMAAFIGESKAAEENRQAAARADAERALRLQAEAAQARADAATRVASRTRVAAAVVCLFLLAAIGAAVTAAMERQEARRQAKEAEANFTAAINGATGVVGAVSDHLRDGLIAKQGARLLLDKAESSLGGLAQADPGRARVPDLEDAQSRLKSGFANVLLALGDSAGSLARAREAAAIADRVAADFPTDARIRSRSVTQNEIGDALSAIGDLPGALAAYQLSAALMEPLTARDPANLGWARDLRVSRDHVAAILRMQGDSAGALALYQAGLAADERLASQHPDDSEAQRDLAIALEHVGDLERVRGDRAGAVKAYERELDVAHALVARAPDNLEWRRMLSVADERAANVLYAAGDIAAALVHERASLATAQALAARDPGNAEWLHDVAVSDLHVGAMLAAQDDFAGALAMFREGLATVQPLIARDPTNVGWPRQAALLQSAIGNILTQQGDYAGAEGQLEASLASFQKVAAAAPGDISRQSDVETAEQVVGVNLMTQGNLAPAVQHFRAGLAIAERLAAADPGSADRAIDLANLRTLLGDALAKQGDNAGALALFEADRAESERLAALHPDNGQWRHEVAVSQQRAGAALQGAGDMQGALAHFKAAAAAADALAAADPGKTQGQRDGIAAEQAIATILMGSSDLAGALDHASAALAKAKALTARDPTNARWRIDQAIAETSVGSALKLMGREDEAKAHFDQGAAILKTSATPTKP